MLNEEQTARLVKGGPAYAERILLLAKDIDDREVKDKLERTA
jgi:hypothetical protein